MTASSAYLYFKGKLFSKCQPKLQTNASTNDDNSTRSADTLISTNLVDVQEGNKVTECSPSISTERVNKCTNLKINKRMKCLIIIFTILALSVFLFLFIYTKFKGTNGNTELESVISIENLTKMAKEYNLKIIREGSCKIPVAKVIPVISSLHKRYTPHCAILHRCSDDTGCCHSNKKVCGPKNTENVTLPFKVSELINEKFSPSKPVLLMFINHTECECKHR